MGIIVFMYAIINIFYYFKLIPPVPLAMDTGLVAHNITIEDNTYFVTYERDEWFVFWRGHRIEFIHRPDENVYVFSSIFAPTDLKKSMFHRWTWFNPGTREWETVEDIGYDIMGGRDNGFRGYTYKNNVKEGLWKVQVITEEELVLGVIDFEIIMNPDLEPQRMIEKRF